LKLKLKLKWKWKWGQCNLGQKLKWIVNNFDECRL